MKKIDKGDLLGFIYISLKILSFNTDLGLYKVRGKHSEYALEETVFYLPVEFIDPDLTLNVYYKDITKEITPYVGKGKEDIPYQCHTMIKNEPHMYVLSKEFNKTGKYYLIPSKLFFSKGIDKLESSSFLQKMPFKYQPSSFVDYDNIMSYVSINMGTEGWMFEILDCYFNNKRLKRLVLDETFTSVFVEEKAIVKLLVEKNGSVAWIDLKHFKLH